MVERRVPAAGIYGERKVTKKEVKGKGREESLGVRKKAGRGKRK